MLEPERVHWCDGSDEEYERSARGLVAAGTFTRLDDELRPELLLGPLRPGRRRARRGPHVHLQRARGRRRPDQQLARPRRDARRAARALHRARCAAARSTSCRSRWARSARRSRTSAWSSPTRPTSRSRMRMMTRMGAGRARRARRRRRVRALRALGRRAARARPGRRAVAVQHRRQVHRALPGDARDLVVRLGLRRQRAARQEVLRAAHRVGDGARGGLARRAHADPQADGPDGRGALRRRRVPVGLRQDEPRDARADAARLEGRDDRRRHRLDEVRRRRPPVRDQPRVRLLRRRARHRLSTRTRTRWPRSGATPSSRTPRSRPTATCGGRA